MDQQISADFEEQQNLWKMVDELFPEDIQDLIRTKFERIKGLTQSELIMDSNASDHHIHLMMMVANEDSGVGGIKGNQYISY